MSPAHEPLTTFERNARTVLEESVRRIDARTRSRLNQARHAALEAAQHHRTGWRSFTLMPAAGVAAVAVLVAVTLWHRNPGGELPLLEGQRSAMEDIDLLSDSEGLDLVQNGDGSFYEWAAAQTDNGESEG
jgi:anti-sigma-K factor RskA